MSEHDHGPAAHLREQTEPEWERALHHPLVTRAEEGTLPTEVFERFVLINAHFLRTYRRFLMVMGTIAPDVRASKVMFANLQGVDHEIADAADFVARRGLDPRLPSARAMDYTSFVMACSGQGWGHGLVVTYAVESLFYECWARVREAPDVAGEVSEFIDSWTRDHQLDIVEALRVLVDQQPLTSQLERTYRSVLKSEIASWDEAFDPAPPRRHIDVRRSH